MTDLEKAYNKVEKIDSFQENSEIKSIIRQTYADRFKAKKDEPIQNFDKLKVMLDMADNMSKLERQQVFAKFLKEKMDEELKKTKDLIDKLT